MNYLQKRTEPSILRPLPLEIMKSLKPYAAKMFEEDNKDMIKFLDELGHDFNSNNTEYRIIHGKTIDLSL